ncbi:MAG: hypothetical protein A2020_02040 [Lentisphaerae bacterium GWF2_45_14]|nr:MAG: hypothetical protein A2020_02040 [Lentisphaerae bacterium GWF2_45_14]
MDQSNIKKIIAEQLTKGVSLSDIHKLLYDEHKIRMTFMDLRLMASEIENIDWSKSDTKATAVSSAVDAEESIAEDETSLEDDEITEDDGGDALPGTDSGAEGPRGVTSVEVNKIARPGAVLSGSVNFGSGASAEWVLDQMGRIALTKAVGKPDEQDVKEFQVELQKAVSHGY